MVAGACLRPDRGASRAARESDEVVAAVFGGTEDHLVLVCLQMVDGRPDLGRRQCREISTNHHDRRESRPEQIFEDAAFSVAQAVAALREQLVRGRADGLKTVRAAVVGVGDAKMGSVDCAAGGEDVLEKGGREAASIGFVRKDPGQSALRCPRTERRSRHDDDDRARIRHRCRRHRGGRCVRR